MQRVPNGKYNKEFREEAIKLVTEEKLSLPEAARRLSLPPSTLANWMKAQKAGKLGEIGKTYFPISPSLPAFCAFIQFAKVDGGRDNRRAASGNDNFSSVTSFIASSRNSLLYFPFGTLCILTPPSLYFTQLWCPLNPSYLMRGDKEKRLKTV